MERSIGYKVMRLFHGTDKESKDAILKEGFKPSECSDYGLAVYFSDNIETAKAYTFDNTVLEAFFDGFILDLQNPKHFEIYKKCNGNTALLNVDALKDNGIIAVFNINKIKKYEIYINRQQPS